MGIKGLGSFTYLGHSRLPTVQAEVTNLRVAICIAARIAFLAGSRVRVGGVQKVPLKGGLLGIHFLEGLGFQKVLENSPLYSHVWDSFLEQVPNDRDGYPIIER